MVWRGGAGKQLLVQGGEGQSTVGHKTWFRLSLHSSCPAIVPFAPFVPCLHTLCTLASVVVRTQKPLCWVQRLDAKAGCKGPKGWVQRQGKKGTQAGCKGCKSRAQRVQRQGTKCVKGLKDGCKGCNGWAQRAPRLSMKGMQAGHKFKAQWVGAKAGHKGHKSRVQRLGVKGTKAGCEGYKDWVQKQGWCEGHKGWA